MPYKRKQKRTSFLYLRGLSADIKAHFKAWCFKRGLTMTGAVENFMRQAIKDEVIKKE